MFKGAEGSGSLDKMPCTSVLHAPNGTTKVGKEKRYRISVKLFTGICFRGWIDMGRQ